MSVSNWKDGMKRAKMVGRADLGHVGNGEIWQEVAESKSSVLEIFI